MLEVSIPHGTIWGSQAIILPLHTTILSGQRSGWLMRQLSFGHSPMFMLHESALPQDGGVMPPVTVSMFSSEMISSWRTSTINFLIGVSF